MNVVKTARSNRRDEIITAAAQVFLATGYGETSIDTVAREAGVSKPTIYKYFDNKEELFLAIVDTISQKLLHPLSEVDLHAKAPVEAMELFGTRFITGMLTDNTVRLFRLMVAEGSRFTELPEAFLTRASRPVRDRLVAYFEEQNKIGTMDIRDTELAVWQFMGLMEQPSFWPVVMRVRPMPNSEEVEYIVKQAIDVFLCHYLTPEMKEKYLAGNGTPL